MNANGFNILLGSNWDYYLYSLLICSVFFYFYYKSESKSIIDPLTYLLLVSCFASSVVLFLYFEKEIANDIFFYFLMSEAAFLIGIKVFKRIKVSYSKKIIQDDFLFIKILNMLSFLILVVVQLMFFYKNGVPILMRSRQIVFGSTDGSGLYIRIIYTTSFIVLFSSIYLISKRKIKTLLGVLQVGTVGLFSFSTGSKSSLLIIVFVYFFIMVYKYLYVKVKKRWVVLILVIPLVTNMILHNVNFFTALIYTGFRFVKYGDIFYISLPNNIYKSVQTAHNGIYMLFSGFLGFFRIRPWSSFGQPLGFQLYDLVNLNTDLLRGPNVRHNIFGLIYFGKIGGVIFSFWIGLIVSYFRKLFDNFKYQSFLRKMFIAFILLRVYSLNTDPVYTFSRINDVLFFLPIIFISQFVKEIILIVNNEKEKNTYSFEYK